MKNSLELGILVTAMFLGWNSGAATVNVCEQGSHVVARAEDEVCDYLVDAAENCFEKLNEGYALLAARPDKTSAKDILSEAEPMKDRYNAGISTVNGYFKFMTDKDTCGDQKERVKVMIDEMKTDLKGITERISKAKGR